MVYLLIEDNAIRLLYVKRTVLRQYEVGFFSKRYTTEFLNNGRIRNADLVASAIKEAYTYALDPEKKEERLIKDKSVFLLLPQEAFYFFRVKAPADIAQTAMDSYIKDKARMEIPVSLDECLSHYFVKELGGEKQILFFAIEKQIFQQYEETFSLLELKIEKFIPETAAYFTLFEKTLRKEKKENILFVHYSEEEKHGFKERKVKGYLYDSIGLLKGEKWEVELTNDELLEEVLSKKRKELEKEGIRLDRIILSGKSSEKIRQDTFTKKVGVWTNPMERIIDNFYDQYSKLLMIHVGRRSFSLLKFDACFGGFIIDSEKEKNGFIKKGRFGEKRLLKVSPPRKELAIFFVSFILSFLLFLIGSRFYRNLSLRFKREVKSVSPSPVITLPPPTPTKAIAKKDLKIKVLNGSGVRGKAGEVKDMLKEMGYDDIVVGNADSFDYQKTEVQVKDGDKDVANIILKDLKDYISQPKISKLEKNQAADVVIILGQDFK